MLRHSWFAWKRKKKKSSSVIHQGAGKRSAKRAPDGTYSRVALLAAFFFFSFKSKTSGGAMQPSLYLPEPDAAEQLLNSMNDSWRGERPSSRPGPACLIGNFHRAMNMHETLNPSRREDLSNDLYLINMEEVVIPMVLWRMKVFPLFGGLLYQMLLFPSCSRTWSNLPMRKSSYHTYERQRHKSLHLIMRHLKQLFATKWLAHNRLSEPPPDLIQCNTLTVVTVIVCN